MSKNSDNLRKAKENKDDEFYTTYDYIDSELKYYKDKFKNKVVYCPCDNYRWSQFTKYFKDKFNELELKKLICSCYNKEGHGTLYVFDGQKETVKEMFSSGDFRHEEVKSIMKKVDIVCTNPPFSLFKQFFEYLIYYTIDFLIVSPFNRLFRRNNLNYIMLFSKDVVRMGTNNIHNAYFSTDKNKTNEVDVAKPIKCMWTTTFKIPENDPKNRNFLELTHTFDDSYKFLDDRNILNADKVIDIPKDYTDVIAVPVTFIDKWNPNQFELLGLSNERDDAYINGKCIFTRLLIKKV
jgi:hypothetical protein